MFASYDPGFVVAGGSVYLLATEFCLFAALRPWSERIEALEKSGDWIPALALAVVRGLLACLYPHRVIPLDSFCRTTTKPFQRHMQQLLLLLKCDPSGRNFALQQWPSALPSAVAPWCFLPWVRDQGRPCCSL